MIKSDFFKKLAILFSLFALGFALVFLVVRLILSLNGYDMKEGFDILQLLSNGDNIGLVKILIFAQHLILFILLPIIYISIIYQNRWKSFLLFDIPKFEQIVLFGALLISLYPVMGYLAHFISTLNLPEWMNSLDTESMSSLESLLVMDNVGVLVVNIFVIGILPGIGEELLFRGVIQKELMVVIKNPHLSIFITALIFGLFHFQVVGLFPKVLIGMVLGYAYFYTKNIIVPMLLHALNNSLATISMYFFQKNIEETKTENFESLNFWLVLLFFGLSMIIFIRIQRHFKEVEHG